MSDCFTVYWLWITVSASTKNNRYTCALPTWYILKLLQEHEHLFFNVLLVNSDSIQTSPKSRVSKNLVPANTWHIARPPTHKFCILHFWNTHLLPVTSVAAAIFSRVDWKVMFYHCFWSAILTMANMHHLTFINVEQHESFPRPVAQFTWILW